MDHLFQSTSYGGDRKPSPGLACVTRERDGTRPGPIAIGVWLHRLMTMLPTDYSICDQDKDLMHAVTNMNSLNAPMPTRSWIFVSMISHTRNGMLWRANSTWPLAFSRHYFPGTTLPILGGRFATTTPRLAFSAAITAISSNPAQVCFFFWGMSPGRVWPLRC